MSDSRKGNVGQEHECRTVEAPSRMKARGDADLKSAQAGHGLTEFRSQCLFGLGVVPAWFVHSSLQIMTSLKGLAASCRALAASCPVLQ